MRVAANRGIGLHPSLPPGMRILLGDAPPPAGPHRMLPLKEAGAVVDIRTTASSGIGRRIAGTR
jgi:hypothetical protein